MIEMKFELVARLNKTDDQIIGFIECNEICTIEVLTVETKDGLVYISVQPYWADEPSLNFTEFCQEFNTWLFSK